MTRGEHGAIAVRHGHVELEVAARAVDVVDTTAAGDTFVGGLVAWLADDAPLQDALRAATVAASLCVTRLGTSSAIPERDEIVENLASFR
jgi:ribokinase